MAQPKYCKYHTDIHPQIPFLYEEPRSGGEFYGRLATERTTTTIVLVNGVQPPMRGRSVNRQAHSIDRRGGSHRADAPFSGIHKLLRLGGAPRRISPSIGTVPGIGRIEFLTEDSDDTTLEHHCVSLLDS